MIVSGATYLEVSVASTTASSTGGDVLFHWVGVHSVYVLHCTLVSTILRVSSYILLFNSKKFSRDDSLFIWFTALGTSFIIDFGCLELTFMKEGNKFLLLKCLKMLLSKSSVISRKLTIFKFEAISVLISSSLNVLIIFLWILKVLRPLLSGMKMIPSSAPSWQYSLTYLEYKPLLSQPPGLSREHHGYVEVIHVAFQPSSTIIR